jgi:hypothetical protein
MSALASLVPRDNRDMKRLALLLTLLLITCAPSNAQNAKSEHAMGRDFDDTTRFIFYSVLEGCYEDGLSNQDVDQILMKAPNKWTYFHFIYACPVCMPTIWALEAYRSRPAEFFSLKNGHDATFGPGLADVQHKQLFSDDPHQRLRVINALVKKWIARRMDDEHLTVDQRTALAANLEKKREQGMDCLKSFRKADPASPNGISGYAPAYTDLDECAVCNGAVGKLMPLPDASAK